MQDNEAKNRHLPLKSPQTTRSNGLVIQSAAGTNRYFISKKILSNNLINSSCHHGLTSIPQTYSEVSAVNACHHHSSQRCGSADKNVVCKLRSGLDATVDIVDGERLWYL